LAYDSLLMSAPARAELGEVTWGWWLLVLVGVLGVVAGVIILAKPGSSLPTLAVIAGIFLLVDGIFELAAAFMRSTRNRGLVALMGVLTAVIGVLLIRHPISGVAAIALLIGIWLIAVGVIRIVTAFDELEHRGWHALAGAVELIVGIVIVANPDIGFATLAILVGIGFILNGVALMVLGFGLRSVRRDAASPA
jgi:uncharacterized membrane protein HdeD (DUF308 family)